MLATLQSKIFDKPNDTMPDSKIQSHSDEDIKFIFSEMLPNKTITFVEVLINVKDQTLMGVFTQKNSQAAAENVLR